jgi:hypothetical protein
LASGTLIAISSFPQELRADPVLVEVLTRPPFAGCAKWRERGKRDGQTRIAYRL